VLKDPRLETTQSELEELLDFSLEVRDKISQVQRNIAAIHKVQGELLMLQQRKAVKGTGLVNRAQEVIEELDEVASELYKHRKSGDHAHLHPELTTSYARIYTMLISSDHRPPNSARERFEDLRPEFNRHVDRLEEVLKSEVRALNKTLQGQGISPISVPSVAR
jgi:ElaB/YqjD/DUF883 family membrane-anchored ribosome-binding protein